MRIKPNPGINTSRNGYCTKYTTGVRIHLAGALRKSCSLIKAAMGGEYS